MCLGGPVQSMCKESISCPTKNPVSELSVNLLFFGQPTTVIYSDHNPLTYITESSTKSAKLMR